MNTRLNASIAMVLIGLSSVVVTHQASACGLNGLHVTAAHAWWRQRGRRPLILKGCSGGAGSIQRPRRLGALLVLRCERNARQQLLDHQSSQNQTVANGWNRSK